MIKKHTRGNTVQVARLVRGAIPHHLIEEPSQSAFAGTIERLIKNHCLKMAK